VADKDGNAVPNAEPLVRVHIDGDAMIAGVDNGDQIDHERFQRDSVRLFAGKALVIVRAGHRAGPITLTASSSGLRSGAARIELRRVESRE
jgi:beta-galactosidase